MAKTIYSGWPFRATTLTALIFFFAAAGLAPANDNIWTDSTSNWGIPTNWSQGFPTSGENIYITNASTKTVTIDASTPSSSLTISNLTLSNPSGSNILALAVGSATPPLHILVAASLQQNGFLMVQNNSLLQIDNSLDISGTMTLLSGAANINDVVLPGTPLSSGTLNIAGGTFTIGSGALAVAEGLFSTGAVNIANGNLKMNGSGMVLGAYGEGHFTISNGTANIPNVQIGNSAGSHGTLTIASGGTIIIPQYLWDGNGVGANPCTVTVATNGSLYVTNGSQTAYLYIAGNSTFVLNGFAQLDALVNTNGGTCITSNGTLAVTQPASVDNGSTATFSTSMNTFLSGLTVAASTTSTSAIQMASSVLNVSSNLTVAAGSNSVGTVSVVNGSSLSIAGAFGLANNGTTASGSGTAIATISNSTVTASSLTGGSTAGGLAVLTLQNNASISISSNVTFQSSSLTATSSITMNGGNFSATNGLTQIGPNGSARFIQNNGIASFGSLQFGGTNGSGEGHFIGGNTFFRRASANFIVVDGGDLDGSGGTVVIGENHNAAMQIASGITKAGTMFVGYSPGFTGTLTQSGGIVNVFTNLVVGDCINGAVGNATLTGGIMYVTNQSHTAVLDVRSGTFTLNAGATLVVDTLVVTNGCGQFVNLGGTLQQNNPHVLSPALDADGDGQSNASEAAAGTDPLNPNSTFQITGIARTQGTNVLVNWTTVGGHSYILQTNANLTGGTFQDFSPAITVPGVGAGTTGYIHTNAIPRTNSMRFYRVRLGP